MRRVWVLSLVHCILLSSPLTGSLVEHVARTFPNSARSQTVRLLAALLAASVRPDVLSSAPTAVVRPAPAA